MDINPIYFPQTTNRESWQYIFTLSDDDTGDLLDLTGKTFAAEVRRSKLSSGWRGNGYGGPLSIGAYDDWSGGPIIQLSLGNGLVVTGLGTLQMTMTVDQMRTLEPDTYSIALTMTDTDGSVAQVFLGRLPVLYGGVS